jgi:hypothetical protein
MLCAAERQHSSVGQVWVKIRLATGRTTRSNLRGGGGNEAAKALGCVGSLLVTQPARDLTQMNAEQGTESSNAGADRQDNMAATPGGRRAGALTVQSHSLARHITSMTLACKLSNTGAAYCVIIYGYCVIAPLTCRHQKN